MVAALLVLPTPPKTMNQTNSKNNDFSIVTLGEAKQAVKYIRRIIVILLIAHGMFLLHSTFYTNNTLGIMVGNIIILSFFFYYTTEDTSNIVTGMILWLLIITTANAAWVNGGLFDASLALIPTILFLSPLFSGRLMMLSMAAFAIAVLISLAYSHENLWQETLINNGISLWSRATNMILMVVISCLCGDLIATRLKSIVAGFVADQACTNDALAAAKRKSDYDDLTGLPNTSLCQIRISELLAVNNTRPGLLGFMTLGLSNFKGLNSTFGHQFGDQVLLRLSKLLRTVIGSDKSIYKGSGGTFILLADVGDYEELTEIANRLLIALNQPLSHGNYEVELSGNIGIAIAPFDGDSYQTLMQKSHTALAKAREVDQNSLCFFEPEFEASLKSRFEMAQQLRRALENNEFELHYQPKVDMDHNTIVGAEALIRWRKEDGNLVRPDLFIPLAEASGQIHEIGKWALHQACNDCRRWQQLGHSQLHIAVNLSAVQFKRGNLPESIFHALAQARLDPNYLEVEITESIFIDNMESIQEQIARITSRGISVAIDDFGTGYSNLNYLNRFNASNLKIDMSFVKNMLNSRQNQHIVKAIIKMSQELGVSNVAEGVEDGETAAALKKLGCAYGQGYYWSKPLPYKEFIELLTAEEPIPPPTIAANLTAQ
jgi:diguanylate cyclase (GGDEF)-like protein